MHRSTIAVAAFALATTSWAQRPPTVAPADPLIVHEWGTFTSMQGADGVTLSGLQWEEESLPKFVHSLTRFGGQRGAAGPRQKKLSKVRSVTQKMETPVIYFHTKSKRRVLVRVEFKKGLMTQWYPVARTMWPWPEGLRPLKNGAVSSTRAPFDMGKVKQSHLEWHVDLIPLEAGLPSEIPAVPADDPWQFAREVHAASVRTVKAKGSKTAAQAERYLFYRGLGTFTLPMQVKAEREGVATFRNGDARRVPFALAMEVTEHGGRVQSLGQVGARQSKAIALRKEPLLPFDQFLSRVHSKTLKALRAEGLRTDEATAMLRTWSRQWFTTKGSRVIYVLPRQRVDQMLPLRITPKPNKLVRVLVGRLEYLTPETEDAVTKALSLRASEDPAQRERGTKALNSLGRFQEPKVRRILARTTSKKIRKAAKQVLATLAK